MSRAMLLAAVAAVIVAGACAAGDEAGPREGPVPLLVLVRDQRQGPVTGAGITVDGTAVGATDDDGRLEAVLAGPDGRPVEVEVTCPAGLVPAGGSRRDFVLRRLKPVNAPDGRLAPVEGVFACAPALREHLLVVRTDGRAGLPVLMGGEAVTRTGPSGAAHVVMSEPPGEEIEIVIDTAPVESLRPRSPSRRLSLPGESRIVLFDQRFEEHKAKRAPRRRGPALPRRL